MIYIGVLFDSNLTFKAQKINSAYSMLGVIKRNHDLRKHSFSVSVVNIWIACQTLLLT